jgi:hypothetical protein
MRKGVIDLDWLNGEIEQTKEKIKVFQEGHILQVVQIAILGKLEVVLSKCQPIEEEKEIDLPNYCVVKNKEYCFLSGKCKECSPPIKEIFLSKTCTNNWEDKKFCENTGKCEFCKIKQ